MILKLLFLSVAVLVLAIGLGCLNYTVAWSVSRHAEWAAEYGLPEPSRELLRIGMGATALGGFLAGFFLKKR